MDRIVRHDIGNYLMPLHGFAEIMAYENYHAKKMSMIMESSAKIKTELKEENPEIRGHLSLISGILQTLPVGEYEEWKSKMLDSVARIKHALEIARICAGEKREKTFSFEEEVRKLKKGFQEICFEEDKTFIFKADCLFPQAIATVLQNAFYHGKATRIDIRTKKKDDSVIIVIKDNGAGIKKEVKGRIFEKGVTTKEGLKGGDGLYFVKEILLVSGAEIAEVSQEGEGAIFEINIPQESIYFFEE